jgi:hypothetical protein
VKVVGHAGLIGSIRSEEMCAQVLSAFQATPRKTIIAENSIGLEGPLKPPVGHRTSSTQGEDMKQPQILVLVPLMIGLAQSGVAQSSTSPTNTASSSQTKQDKKAEKSKPNNALAARKGIPDHENTPQNKI